MSYADYDLRTAVQTFGLTEGRDTDIFAAVGPLEPSEFLRVWLDEFAPLALGVNTERARSEFIKLEGSTLFIDQPEYYLREAPKILGILVSIARG